MHKEFGGIGLEMAARVYYVPDALSFPFSVLSPTSFLAAGV